MKMRSPSVTRRSRPTKLAVEILSPGPILPTGRKRSRNNWWSTKKIRRTGEIREPRNLRDLGRTAAGAAVRRRRRIRRGGQ